MYPLRRPHITWETLGAEVALLDQPTGRAHSLGGVAAAVWIGADGSTNAQRLADQASHHCCRKVSVDEVRNAVEVLDGLDVLDMGRGLSRRRVLGLGAAAVASAGVISIALPSPAMAASATSVIPDGFNDTEGFSVVGDYVGGSAQNGIDSLALLFPSDAGVTSVVVFATHENGASTENLLPLQFGFEFLSDPLVAEWAGLESSEGGSVLTFDSFFELVYWNIDVGDEEAVNDWLQWGTVRVDFLDGESARVGWAYFPGNLT